MAPMGARERVPKGQNHANFKVTSSPDPEVEQSSYVVFNTRIIKVPEVEQSSYVVFNTRIIKVVHGSSQGGPNGPVPGRGAKK